MTDDIINVDYREKIPNNVNLGEDRRLQRALELDPSRVRAHYFISLCFRDLGWDRESAEAMERWRKAEEALRSSHGGRKAGERRLPEDD